MVNPANDSRSAKGIRLGVALAPGSLCAVDAREMAGAARVWRAPLEPPPTDGTPWASLSAALSELARVFGVRDAALAIALLPPLAEARRLELPPLNDVDLQRLLTRDSARYFVNARGPQLIGTSRGSRRARGTAGPVLVAAASVRLVASIRASARLAGFDVDAIEPVESSWAGAAVAMWPMFARNSAFAVVAGHDRTDLLQLDNGRLVGVRRFRGLAVDAAMIAETVGPTARVGIAGVPDVRRELANAITAIGASATLPTGEWNALADDAERLAAQFAGRDVGPVLRSDDTVALERAESRRATWTVLGAAAALFVLAAGAELWGVHRQLAAVRAERQRLRPQIASTLLGRSTVDATYRRLAALNAIERNAPKWSNVIVALSDAVPEQAYLTAVRVRQDSLVVDGLAERAARVFDALANVPGLIDVRAAAPVRREAQEDGPALEHFTIGARVESPRAAVRPATAPAAARTTRRPDQ